MTTDLYLSPEVLRARLAAAAAPTVIDARFPPDPGPSERSTMFETGSGNAHYRIHFVR
jgi:hypothetical protein